MSKRWEKSEEMLLLAHITDNESDWKGAAAYLNENGYERSANSCRHKHNSIVENKDKAWSEVVRNLAELSVLMGDTDVTPVATLEQTEKADPASVKTLPTFPEVATDSNGVTIVFKATMAFFMVLVSLVAAYALIELIK